MARIFLFLEGGDEKKTSRGENEQDADVAIKVLYHRGALLADTKSL